MTLAEGGPSSGDNAYKVSSVSPGPPTPLYDVGDNTYKVSSVSPGVLAPLYDVHTMLCT